ncbi:MAG: hypothetical protein JJU02_15270 [Cryomorphaceae bacterium]|nr:hypothetical protein [Cryomorphaceae bacterium]
MVSLKIDAEGIFEPEQVRIQKSTDKEDFGGKGLFRADLMIKSNPKEQTLWGCFFIISLFFKSRITLKPQYLCGIYNSNR